MTVVGVPKVEREFSQIRRTGSQPIRRYVNTQLGYVTAQAQPDHPVKCAGKVER